MHCSRNTGGVSPAVHITWASVKSYALAESWNLVVTEFLAQRRLADLSPDFSALFSFSAACDRHDAHIPRCRRHKQDDFLAEISLGHLGNCGSVRALLSVVWHVAVLGSNRQYQRLDEEDLVYCFTHRILVGKCAVLLLCVPSPDNPQEENGNMRNAFGRVLLAGWVFLGGFVFLLSVFPKQVVRIPHLELIRPFMITLTFLSIVYGLVWLYRQGMSRAKK